MSRLTDMLEGKVEVIKVYETEHFVALMEPTPNALGHVICFPKRETNDLFSLDSHTYHALMSFVQLIAKALKAVVPCRKIGMASIGLAVEHVHIHLVPINAAVDMNFMANHADVEEASKEKLAKQIRAQIDLLLAE